MSNRIGEKIKSLRNKKDWSLRELEKRTGIDYSVLSRIESGKRPVTDQEMNVFADLFEVTTDYLLGRSNVDINEADDKKEMMEFFNNPRLNLFFKEMADSPEEQLEELQEFWEIIKKRGLNKK
ncbi:helix-turn-helix domain-containing protein [Domibacillus tundrae]|uniref:helix-turn-helix domain-containing protein n=1 Tax=Domibacillus tundrae TaxID=1587527 RepID=UPI0033989250